jgi:type I restriction enzyme S subunit
MVIENGYKQTEAGLIPEEWAINKLENVVEFFNGKAHENYISDLGRFVVINSKFISSNGTIAKNSIVNLCALNKGDIAIVMSDIPNGKALAKCFIVPCDKIYALNQRIGGLRSIKQNSNYLFYQLNRNKYFLSYDSGSGQTNLRKQEVLDCPVLIPPLPEQTAIATALSDMDALIAQTEKLIEKKKAIKQGVMQESLRPKEGWLTKKLGNIATFQKGKGLPKSKINEYGKFKCIHYGELFTKYNEIISDILSYTDDNENCFYSQVNDVLMPTSDVTPNGLATASCVKEDGIILGGDVLVIRLMPNILDGIFLSYFISQNKEKIMKLVTGSTVYHLYGSDMKDFEVSFPDITTQVEIIRAISDLDSVISVLKIKHEKLQLKKQGMMQALLTGKIRLI